MTFYKSRNYFDWKVVEGNFERESAICTRCGNLVNYKLVFDADEVGYLGLLTFKHNKKYAYKCPICPQHESIPALIAKNIIKGNIC